MKNYSPITLIQNLRVVYSRYSSTFDVKVKWWILAIICVLVIDNSLEISNQLFVNTKIDTIEHVLSTNSTILDSTVVKHKEAIVREYINHQTIWERIGSVYKAKPTEETYCRLIRLVAPILFPLFLVIVWIWYFIKTVFTSTPKQNEQIANMSFIILFLFLFIILLQSLSSNFLCGDISTVKIVLMYIGLNAIPYISTCWLANRLLK